MMMKTFVKGFGEPVSDYSTPLFFDLLIDPKEEHPTDPRVVEDLWARFPITKALSDHLASLKNKGFHLSETERPALSCLESSVSS
jgi:hypothetical protein